MIVYRFILEQSSIETKDHMEFISLLQSSFNGIMPQTMKSHEFLCARHSNGSKRDLSISHSIRTYKQQSVMIHFDMTKCTSARRALQGSLQGAVVHTV